MRYLREGKKTSMPKKGLHYDVRVGNGRRRGRWGYYICNRYTDNTILSTEIYPKREQNGNQTKKRKRLKRKQPKSDVEEEEGENDNQEDKRDKEKERKRTKLYAQSRSINRTIYTQLASHSHQKKPNRQHPVITAATSP